MRPSNFKTLATLLCATLCGSAAQAASPYNAFLADSSWPQVHQGPWQQDSTPNPGPTTASQLGNAQYVATGTVNIAVLESPLYPNGGRVLWGGTVDKIYKLAVVGGQLTMISSTSRYGSVTSNQKSPFAGGYTALRYDNVYLTGATRTILAYRDTTPGDMNSSISLYKSYEIPLSVVPDSGTTPDQITGMNVLFDGKIAVATRGGYVGVVDIENGTGTFRKVADGEKISNSIAVASNDGIYVVSDKALYRFQWDRATSTLYSPLGPTPCDLCWRSDDYPKRTDGGAQGSYSNGSGSTPSLMGPNGEYVVITDGAKVTNLSVYRTGKLQPGQLRLAAAQSVNFGDLNRTETASEQSVVVSGYGMAVVSNDYKDVSTVGDDLPLVTKLAIDPILALPAMQNIPNARVTLTGYGPRHQPWGVQKFSFDPSTGTLKSDWVRLDVSCPNAVPVMSEANRRFYCVGAKNLYWTVEAMDWDTGAFQFRKNIGLLPRYNSFYSTLQLTANGGVLYGSVDGVVYLPKQ